MVKHPKGKKNKADEDFPDDVVDLDPIAGAKNEVGDTEAKAAPKKNDKKTKGKKKAEDDHDDDNGDAATEVIGEVKGTTKKSDKKTKGKKKEEDSEPEDYGAKREASDEGQNGSGSKAKKKGKILKEDWVDRSGDELTKSMGKLKLTPAASAKAPAKKSYAALDGDESASEDDEIVDLSRATALPKKQQPRAAAAAVRKYHESDEETEATRLATSQASSKKKTAPTTQNRGFMVFGDLSDEQEDSEAAKSDSDDEPGLVKEQQPLAAHKQKTKKEKKKDKKKDTKEEDDIDAILAGLNEKAGAEKNKKDKGKLSSEKDTMEAATPLPAAAVAAVVKEISADDLADELESKQKKKKKDKGKPSSENDAAKAVTSALTAAAAVPLKEIDADDLADELESEQTKKKKGKKTEKDDKAGSSQAGSADVAKVSQKKADKALPAKKSAGEKQQSAEASTGEASIKSTSSVVEPAELADEKETAEKEEEGKKKKKKGKEEKKKPVNKRVEAMKEALAKLKEEEERMRREAEEKEQREEEARRLKEEQLRLEEERKLRKKQKEKEKIERKKKEGTFLTEKQKMDRKRAMQMLQAMGVAVPDRDNQAKKPVYGKVRKLKKSCADEDDAKGAKEGVELAEDEEREDNEEADDAVAAMEETVQDIAAAAAAADDQINVSSSEDAAAVSGIIVEAENLKEDWAASSEEEEEEESDEVKGTAGNSNVPVVPASAKLPSGNVASGTHEHKEKESAGDSEDSESDDEEDEDESDDEEEEKEEEVEELPPKEKARARILKRQEEAEKKRTTDRLRAAVVCVLGHVDTGKTKILDKLRHTNVQDNEAGGITQQIGATNVPADAIKEQTKMCKEFTKQELRLPGLLIIDTPGHESFSNLRSRGSSLCDIAILVVDLMHGLEPQTIESINLLKQRKTPFIVALNKVDRLFQWKTNPHADIQNTIKKQQLNTKQEFDERTKGIIVQFAEQGLNAALFYENKNPREYVSLVPTSAHTGDGMGNLIALVCEVTQSYLAKRVALSDDLRATVMEVKALPGLGTTVDVILVDGQLRVGDIIVVPGIDGPIVTHVRELLMPQPMRELRVKSQYVHHKEVVAAQGVKVVAKDLEKALAGLPLYVAQQPDEVDVYRDWLSEALKNALNSIKCSERGVYVQASTLGSLEALLEYLRSVKVPYSGINIGPVHKRDVMRASVMMEHGEVEHSCILAFDVKVEREAQEMADGLSVRIFTADIIYHLFDAFQKYQDELLRRGREEHKAIAVFPCKLRVLPQFVFNSRDPIVMGVIVEEGFVSPGTPICVPSKEFVDIGVVSSVEFNHKPIEAGKKGQEVCVKIDAIPGEAPKMFGRHFDEKDMLVSKISRASIDAVKKYFKAEMSKDDWKLIIELKKVFDIL